MKKHQSLLLKENVHNTIVRTITYTNGTYKFSDSCQGCQGFLTGSYRPNSSPSGDGFIMLLPHNIFKSVGDMRELADKWISFLQLFEPQVRFMIFDTIPYNKQFPFNETTESSSSRKISESYWNEFSANTMMKNQYGINRSNYDTLSGVADGVYIPNNISRRLMVTLVRYLARTPYTNIPASVLELYEAGVHPVTALYLGHFGTTIYKGYYPENYAEVQATYTNGLAGVSKFIVDKGSLALNDEYNKLAEQYNIAMFGSHKRGDTYERYNNYYGLIYPEPFNPEQLNAITPGNLPEVVNGANRINGTFSNVKKITDSTSSQDSYFFVNTSPISFTSFIHPNSSSPKWAIDDVKKVYELFVLPTKKLEDAWEKMGPQEFVEYATNLYKSLYDNKSKSEKEPVSNHSWG